MLRMAGSSRSQPPLSLPNVGDRMKEIPPQHFSPLPVSRPSLKTRILGVFRASGR